MIQLDRPFRLEDFEEEIFIDDVELLERERDTLKAQNIFLKGIYDFLKEKTE